jgi:hypothetical protein
MPDPAFGVVIATRDRRASLLRLLDRIRSFPERPPVGGHKMIQEVPAVAADGRAKKWRPRSAGRGSVWRSVDPA